MTADGSPHSTSAAQPCGTCARCNGTLYAGLAHQCQTSVRLPVQNRLPADGSPQSIITIPPDGLWSEDGDRAWLPLDYADHGTRVKRLFFAGRGIPTCPAKDGAWYSELRVCRAFIRPGEPDEHGWAGSGSDTWWRCEPDHPRAVEAWEVSYA